MREDAECLGMLQDGLNMPCKKFYNPVPKFEGIHEKKTYKLIISEENLVNLLSPKC